MACQQAWYAALNTGQPTDSLACQMEGSVLDGAGAEGGRVGRSLQQGRGGDSAGGQGLDLPPQLAKSQEDSAVLHYMDLQCSKGYAGNL